MKKFASLGRSLSKGEQKQIVGGDDDGTSSQPCTMGMYYCVCGNSDAKFYCCGDFINTCVTNHSCPGSFSCVHV